MFKKTFNEIRDSFNNVHENSRIVCLLHLAPKMCYEEVLCWLTYTKILKSVPTRFRFFNKKMTRARRPDSTLLMKCWWRWGSIQESCNVFSSWMRPVSSFWQSEPANLSQYEPLSSYRQSNCGALRPHSGAAERVVCCVCYRRWLYHCILLKLLSFILEFCLSHEAVSPSMFSVHIKMWHRCCHWGKKNRSWY